MFGTTLQQIRVVLEGHLEQDRDAVLENGLDLIRVVTDMSRSLQDGGHVSGFGLDMEDILNCADGLYKVLLDC